MLHGVGQRFVGQNQQKGDAGGAAQIGDLAQVQRGVHRVADGVVQQLGHQPFGRHPGRGPGQCAHNRAVMTPGEMAHRHERDDLRLEDRRDREQDQNADAFARADEVRDRDSEPGEHGGDDREAHQPRIEHRAGEAAACVEGQQPRHQGDEPQRVGHPAARVQA
jgi:hypothetical protein